MRTLDKSHLAELAAEIRKEIIETVSHTGGHLASSLGVVELTIALHLVFDSPKDKFVWDVGHQSYAHKLLTGRRKQFATLRQQNGLSGFPKREESPHDAFGTGHASTSISAALGLAKARDLKQSNESVVAIIGDGAMTGGLALEGLNNAHDLNTDIIVVLNDNEMSIAQNVTALASHLSKLRAAPIYQAMEQRARSALKRLPHGKRLEQTAEGIYHGVTHLVASETGVLFETLGFRYFGPIDGHNIELLTEVLSSVKRLKGPILVHVLTTKGKGYQYAEDNARRFHGIPGFDISDGKIEHSESSNTFTKAFGETVVQLASTNPEIVAITAAMPDGTGLADFAKRYPDRFFDVGIAEGHAVTFAAGLAAAGMRPIVAIYSSFLQRAFDQIIHDVCLQKLPVIFAIDRAGLVGDDGPTHHGAFDLAYLRHIPEICIMAPKDTNELKLMLAEAVRLNRPVAIRYPRGGCPAINKNLNCSHIQYGRAELLRVGDDAAILAVGPLAYEAIEAANVLVAQGINTSVLNLRFAKPLDVDLILQSAQKCKRIVVAEEGSVRGGVGSAILELLAENNINDATVRLIGLPDEFVGHGNPAKLREQIGLTAAGIMDAVKETFVREGITVKTSIGRLEKLQL